MFVLTDVSQCRLWTFMSFKRRYTTVTTLQERDCLVGFGAVFFWTNVVFLTSCIFWKCNSLFSASMRYQRSYKPVLLCKIAKTFYRWGSNKIYAKRLKWTRKSWQATELALLNTRKSTETKSKRSRQSSYTAKLPGRQPGVVLRLASLLFPANVLVRFQR